LWLVSGRREQSLNTAGAEQNSTGITVTAEIEMDATGTPGSRSRADRNIYYLYISAMRRTEVMIETRLKLKRKAENNEGRRNPKEQDIRL
jgi:hypothetical protein